MKVSSFSLLFFLLHIRLLSLRHVIMHPNYAISYESINYPQTEVDWKLSSKRQTANIWNPSSRHFFVISQVRCLDCIATPIIDIVSFSDLSESYGSLFRHEIPDYIPTKIFSVSCLWILHRVLFSPKTKNLQRITKWRFFRAAKKEAEESFGLLYQMFFVQILRTWKKWESKFNQVEPIYLNKFPYCKDTSFCNESSKTRLWISTIQNFLKVSIFLQLKILQCSLIRWNHKNVCWHFLFRFY